MYRMGTRSSLPEYGACVEATSATASYGQAVGAGQECPAEEAPLGLANDKEPDRTLLWDSART